MTHVYHSEGSWERWSRCSFLLQIPDLTRLYNPVHAILEQSVGIRLVGAILFPSLKFVSLETKEHVICTEAYMEERQMEPGGARIFFYLYQNYVFMCVLQFTCRGKVNLWKLFLFTMWVPGGPNIGGQAWQ